MATSCDAFYSFLLLRRIVDLVGDSKDWLARTTKTPSIEEAARKSDEKKHFFFKIIGYRLQGYFVSFI